MNHQPIRRILNDNEDLAPDFYRLLHAAGDLAFDIRLSLRALKDQAVERLRAHFAAAHLDPKPESNPSPEER